MSKHEGFALYCKVMMTYMMVMIKAMRFEEDLYDDEKDRDDDAHRSGAGIKYQDHLTIWKLGLFLLKTTLTFYHVIILLYTMSQTHKGVHASLNSISGQQSASFHNVIRNVTDIFFPKWALLERCVP